MLRDEYRHPHNEVKEIPSEPWMVSYGIRDFGSVERIATIDPPEKASESVAKADTETPSASGLNSASAALLIGLNKARI